MEVKVVEHAEGRKKVYVVEEDGRPIERCDTRGEADVRARRRVLTHDIEHHAMLALQEVWGRAYAEHGGVLAPEDWARLADAVAGILPRLYAWAVAQEDL